jgi:hypothetical protein
MKTVAELHETRLLGLVASCRKQCLTMLLFALAIVGAGAVRINQARSLKNEAAVYAALPSDWEPLEGFYDHSGHFLDKFADEHSTPWSTGYILITTYLAGLQNLNPNPTIAATMKRVGDLARNLDRYNSDIRTVAAAQRRNLSFRQLSKRELEAVLRIASHKFTPEQEKTVNDTSKTAQLILRIADGARVGGGATNDYAAFMQLRGKKARAMLERLINDDRWSEAETELLASDLYYSSKEGNEKVFAALKKNIDILPSSTIAGAEERRSSLQKQQAALDLDAGLSIPLLGVRVGAAYVTLAAGIINALLVATLCTQLWGALGELRGVQQAASDQGIAAWKLMVRDASYGPGDMASAALMLSTLLAPSAAAFVLFGTEAVRPIILVINGFILATVLVLAAAALWVARKLGSAAGQDLVVQAA